MENVASGSNVRNKVYTNNDVVQIKTTTRNPGIWAHFDLCVMNDGVEKARCKRCGKFYNPTSNSTLRNHMNGACRAVAQQGTQSTLGTEGGVFIYDNEVLREDFAKFVIQEALPFNHFDNQRLTNIIKTRLQPRYQQVSRTTLRNDAFKYWINAKKDIIDGFANYNYGVSITCDVWTAPHGTANSYLAVTAHWFHPESWLLMKRTIAFKLFGYPHTGSNLRKILNDTLIEYNLADKVFTISLDNASNNTNAMNLLKLRIKPVLDGAFFHSRCVAHIINIAVQDALNICAPLREKFRSLLITIYSSSNERQANYRRFRKQCGEVPLGPSYDTPTRWNSTHKMFENILRQRDTLQAFNDILVAKNKSVPISFDEWERLKDLTSFLVVFKEATTLLSGVYYPTSPLVLHQLVVLTEKLKEFETSIYPMFRKMVKVIKRKFIKYFARLPMVFTCSAALNPTLNFGGVKLFMTTIMQNLDLHLANVENDLDFIQNEIARFEKTFENLFGIYAIKYGGAGGAGTSNQIVESMRAGSSREGSRDINVNIFNNLVQEATKRARTMSPSSELGSYRATNFITQMTMEEYENFDIITWWKEKDKQYPILAAIARDLLAVQASTVASESAFSTSGRIISERRSRLTPQAVEVCVCLKDYLDGVDRIQNATTLEGPLLNDVEDTIEEEEVALGISPISTEAEDEGEFDDFEVETDDFEVET